MKLKRNKVIPVVIDLGCDHNGKLQGYVKGDMRPEKKGGTLFVSLLFVPCVIRKDYLFSSLSPHQYYSTNYKHPKEDIRILD